MEPLTCLDTYTDPKILSCFHSFCCKCLEEHARNTHRQGKFRCPECQAEIDLPEGNRFDRLSPSFIHNSLLGLLETEDRKALHKFGEKGNQDGQFTSPRGMCLGGSDNLLVCDYFNDRVQQFSLDGRFTGKTTVPLQSPFQIVTAPDGRILVTSLKAKKIYILKWMCYLSSKCCMPAETRVESFIFQGKFLNKWRKHSTV